MSLVSTSCLAYTDYSGSKIVVPVAKINTNMSVRITNANIIVQLVNLLLNSLGIVYKQDTEKRLKC